MWRPFSVAFREYGLAYLHFWEASAKFEHGAYEYMMHFYLVVVPLLVDGHFLDSVKD